MQTSVEDFLNFTVLCQSFKVVLSDSSPDLSGLWGFFWTLVALSNITDF